MALDQGNGITKVFYRIGEVARIADVDPSVIRHWESEFRALRPRRHPNGQRLYSQSDLKKILEIKRLLHQERYTTEGAIQKLRRSGEEPRDQDDPLLRDNENLRSTLQAIRQDIVEFLARLDRPENE